jgi:hypothetical protein
MSYTINKTNGGVLTTVADGTLDNTTGVTLIGKNYPGYGTTLNENFVRLLENFSNTTAPGSPIAGQLWWDSTNNILKVYTGTAFKNIGGSTTSTTAPGNPIVGDLWWDSTNQQLKVYSGQGGTPWVTIGPAYSTIAGTSGAIVETVTDSLAVTHTIVSLYAGSTRVAIISKDSTFTPSPAITGFATISPGITLASTGVIPNNSMTGAATVATSLAASPSNLVYTDFLRATAASSTNSTLAVANNSGFTVGLSNDAKISVNSGTVIIENQTSPGSLSFRTRTSGGIQNVGLLIDSTGNATVGNLTVSGTITVGGSGGSTLTGNVIPAANNTYNLGASGTVWANVYAVNVYGKASSAAYADLAERYEADAVYVAGTVVSLGGDKEITVACIGDEVFGVISTDPAYLMNANAGNDETHPPVALVGRVPVRVIGPVSKGDKLVVGGAGVAVRYVPDMDSQDDDGNLTAYPLPQDFLIGRALADKYTQEEGLVEVVLAAH